jgi:hypothetical protein
VNEIKTITNDYERKLIGQLGFLQEVFDTFSIVTVRFTANSFHFFNLACFAGSLQSKNFQEYEQQ